MLLREWSITKCAEGEKSTLFSTINNNWTAWANLNIWNMNFSFFFPSHSSCPWNAFNAKWTEEKKYINNHQKKKRYGNWWMTSIIWMPYIFLMKTLTWKLWFWFLVLHSHKHKFNKSISSKTSGCVPNKGVIHIENKKKKKKTKLMKNVII